MKDLPSQKLHSVECSFYTKVVPFVAVSRKLNKLNMQSKLAESENFSIFQVTIFFKEKTPPTPNA